MSGSRTEDPYLELARKDRRIDDLVRQAEKLVSDLNLTVADMKRILEAAAADAREARDESERRPDG